MVASTPTFTFMPSPILDGSREEPRTPVTTSRSVSPRTRVAIAYSTSAMSQGSMSSSTTTTCLSEVCAAKAAMQAFLPSPFVAFFTWTTAWR